MRNSPETIADNPLEGFSPKTPANDYLEELSPKTSGNKTLADDPLEELSSEILIKNSW